MGEFIGKEDEFINDNIVSIFCGIAPTLYDNGISIDINLLYNYHCFSFSFRDINTGDKRPTTETCLEKWAKLFIEK